MKNANEAIKCNVKQCAYHCGEREFCSLNAIQVGTHESNPTVCECTDCESFSLK